MIEQRFPLGAHVLVPRTIQIAREDEEAGRPPFEGVVTGVELVSRYSLDLHAPIIRELEYSVQCACCGTVMHRPEKQLTRSQTDVEQSENDRDPDRP